MIQTHIVQHLSQGQRGPACRVEVWEIVNAILYKLKSGTQWYLLPVNSLIFSDKISWRTGVSSLSKVVQGWQLA